MKNGLTRRDVLRNLGLAAVGTAGAATVVGEATAAPSSAPSEAPSVLPVGLVAGGYSVVHAAPSRGALRVQLSAPDGDEFVAIVCAHDPAGHALATSGGFDVFVENQGQGDTPTVERHGLSAMALVAALAPYQTQLAGLGTLAERHTTELSLPQ